ncbi:hypothetical protein HWV07_14665 [Natronomonas salina]|uniref:hypothetical protein n=1 Tax=Natronomonas salina TaxID=1710540 RepID=UPI0015B65954|nr:hypothetical protein [Natronomonas salina]QLD90208.1 hypothetical protein HWV07_14665 [Natronomonas salina]
MPHLYIWMSQLKQDGVVMIDWPNKGYLLPKQTDKDPEAYRQQYKWPPEGIGSSGE